MGENHHSETITGSSTNGTGILTAGPNKGELEQGMFTMGSDWGVHNQNQTTGGPGFTAQTAANWVCAGKAKGAPQTFDMMMWDGGAQPDVDSSELSLLVSMKGLVASQCGGGPSPTPTPGGGGGSISTSAWYQVVNQGNNKCVDSGGLTANGSPLKQWGCIGGNYNMEFQFQTTDSGYYRVVSRIGNLAWDVTGVSLLDGAKVQLWTYGGGSNQQWQPVKLDATHYKFVNRNSGKCLDNTGSTTDGVQQTQWACASGNLNQSYSLSQQP